MCVLSIKMPIRKKSLETYLMILVYQICLGGNNLKWNPLDLEIKLARLKTQILPRDGVRVFV